MKKISLLVLAFMSSGLIYSQQLPMLTQFMDNAYVVNPAFAGMEDYYQVRTSIRNQFVGINDFPTSTILSIYGKKDDKVGLGGLVFNDEIGPTSRTGAAVSYTYHFKASKKVNLALALSGGFTQFSINKTDWDVENPNDQLVQGDVIVESVPDATFGFNLYSERWCLGVSIPQLLTSKLNLLDNNFANNLSGEQTGTLSRHVYVIGSYRISAGKKIDIQPSVLIKSVSPTPSQVDIGVKIIYDKNIWIGADYRTNGDLGALFGYSIGDRYLIGYSYDLLNADLADQASGSHEFMFAIKFRTIKNEKNIK